MQISNTNLSSQLKLISDSQFICKKTVLNSAKYPTFTKIDNQPKIEKSNLLTIELSILYLFTFSYLAEVKQPWNFSWKKNN